MDSLFYVFRRDDGYVDAVARSIPFTDPKFEILMVTPHWVTAKECIISNRDTRHDAVVASWN